MGPMFHNRMTSKEACKSSLDEENNDLVTKVDNAEGKIKAEKFQNTKMNCEHCEKKLNTETQLEIHMQSNHEVQNFKCDKCDQYFITDCTMKKLYKICQDFNSDLRHF